MVNKTIGDLMINKRIGLDVDGVCLDFGTSFIKHALKSDIKLSIGKTWDFMKQDIRAYDLFKNLNNDFWLNLERERKSLDLDFQPVAYISHRGCPEIVTKKCLLNNGFPNAPVIHVKHTEDKIKIARELEVDLFIDDRASTVTYFLESGIKALTLTQKWNEDYSLPRIKTLGEISNIKSETEYDKITSVFK